MRVLIVLAAVLLTGCQTRPTIEQGLNGTFEIRYDPVLSSAQDADSEAAAQCGEPAEFLGQRSRWDSMVFRRYRCAQ